MGHCSLFPYVPEATTGPKQQLCVCKITPVLLANLTRFYQRNSFSYLCWEYWTPRNWRFGLTRVFLKIILGLVPPAISVKLRRTQPLTTLEPCHVHQLCKLLSVWNVRDLATAATIVHVSYNWYAGEQIYFSDSVVRARECHVTRVVLNTRTWYH